MVFTLCSSAFALTLDRYNIFLNQGYLSGSNDMRFNPKGQMFRKFSHFIIDDNYTGGDPGNPFYNEGERNPAVLAQAKFINEKSSVVSVQANDFTASATVMIDKFAEYITPEVINAKKSDPNMTVKKALDEIGKWYVNHMYTYQGGEKSVAVVESQSKKASDSAKGIWSTLKAEKSWKGTETDIVFKEAEKKASSGCAIYECDKFKNLGYTKSNVMDDCSKFASSVFYHYMCKKTGFYDGLGISLFSGSGDFKNGYNDNPKKICYILKNNGFTILDYTKGSTKVISDDFELKAGDLLYREPNQESIDDKNISSAHVEFYIDESHSFGWGEVKNSYEDNPHQKEFRFIKTKEEFIDYFGEDKADKFVKGVYNVAHRNVDENGKCTEQSSCDAGIRYTLIIQKDGGAN